MKDLIKKIEGLKLKTHPEETEYRFGFRDGNNTCVVSVKHILNQHNIITAPKSIKLSEILSRLNEKDYRKFEITRNGTCISLDNTNCYKDYLNIEDNKIVDISYDMQVNDFKWLYTLWIAGSEIIDDLEEKEHE